MERLTNAIYNNLIKCQDCIEESNCYEQSCGHIEKAIHRLQEYENTGLTPEEIIRLHASCNIDVGQTVYVITQYGCGDYEIIAATINRKTVKTRKTFSVNGEYKNGNFYNGTFGDSSIGKTVFLTREDAEKKLNF